MSGTELQEWWLYYQLEPWGEARSDLRMGILAAATVNLYAAEGKASKPSDFMPDFWKLTPMEVEDIQRKKTMAAFKTLSAMGIGSFNVRE